MFWIVLERYTRGYTVFNFEKSRSLQEKRGESGFDRLDGGQEWSDKPLDKQWVINQNLEIKTVVKYLLPWFF